MKKGYLDLIISPTFFIILVIITMFCFVNNITKDERFCNSQGYDSVYYSYSNYYETISCFAVSKDKEEIKEFNVTEGFFNYNIKGEEK